MADTLDRSGTTSTTSGAPTDDVTADVTAWLEENWDPELTVGEWWERLGLSGWAAPTLPSHAYGKGLARSEALAVQQAIRRFGALGAPGGLGLLLAAPTIVDHGTQEQIDRYVRAIVTGQEGWCQLFSEPGAGSDLAGLQCRAVKDGDEWTVSGQKVWTSGGQVANLGMLLARTDADVPKHQGISYFAIAMDQDGVDTRPLREMTGRALFNEVFLTEARVHDDALIGGLNKGWAVANTTLGHERAGLGAGGGSEAASAATPGTIAGDLDKRAGDFVSGGGRERGRSGGGGGGAGGPGALFGQLQTLLKELAKGNGTIADPTVRQGLMHLHTANEIARYTGLRHKALKAAGGDLPGMGNLAKLSMSEIVRQARDLGLAILGGYGMLHAYDEDGRKALDEATGNPFMAMVTEMALFAQGPPIYGGTDQVQRNIIGERVLGLPKEPGDTKTIPFRDLPKNG